MFLKKPLFLLHYTTTLPIINNSRIIIMNQYIDYFLNYLQTEKDAAKSTIHKYRADLERLFEYLQVTDINEINQNHLRDYLNHIRETYNYTSSSIANKVNILHHFFRFLHASGYISSNPAILIS